MDGKVNYLAGRLGLEANPARYNFSGVIAADKVGNSHDEGVCNLLFCKFRE